MIKIRIGDIKVDEEAKALIADILSSNMVTEGKNIPPPEGT